VTPCLSSSLLAVALAAAALLTDDRARAAALVALVPVLPADQQPGVLAQALTAATAIADDEAAPLIAELGGMAATQECAAAIGDVHRWWP